jgi:superfamily II RNA helicase
MPVLCDQPYNNQEYDQYFEQFPYPLSDFQKYAIEAIVQGDHVLVTAHTGSGKTLPAEFAIQHFTSQSKKIIYTSPIKALSNQKYYEFQQKYPAISFGLFTGDIKTNPDAQVLIMTTEILMNTLFRMNINKREGGLDLQQYPPETQENYNRFSSGNLITEKGKELEFPEGAGGGKGEPGVPPMDFNIDINVDLACVVFDEVHYINDKERGQVWEKTMLMLPDHIQMVMLSATIDNPIGFATWCESGRNGCTSHKRVYLASTNKRVVPLSHYGYVTVNDGLFKNIKDKTLEQQIREGTNTLIPLQNENGVFKDAAVHQMSRLLDIFENRQVFMKRQQVLNSLALFLRDREMLPAIAFVFSRKHVELCAKEITVPLLEDDSKVGYIVRRECEQIIRKLPNFQEYLALPEYNQVVALLEKGIGIHHSGMIPVLREIVELMISKKYIKLLFATESFAIGLDCPIKTAIFTSLTKFDGASERYLMPHEYTQMAGRAGRRGLDTVGYIVHCNNLFKLPTLSDYRAVLCGKPQQLVSKFHVTYSLILNLMKNGITCDFHRFAERSMIQNDLAKSICEQKLNADSLKELLEKKRASFAFMKTPYEICVRYLSLENDITPLRILNAQSVSPRSLITAHEVGVLNVQRCKPLVNKKRKDCDREMEVLKNTYFDLPKDIKMVSAYMELMRKLDDENSSMHFMEEFLKRQTDAVCDVLVNKGFVEMSRDDGNCALTHLGKMAASIAEVHPLIISQFMVDQDYFSAHSEKDLVGLFSCFTDVKIVEDKRRFSPPNENLKQLNKMYLDYENMEINDDIRTGIKYDGAIQFDMVDLAMKWAECDDERACKEFIQGDVADKGISVGDFNKAMMKIATIGKELAKVAEELGKMDLLHKLSKIDGLVFKYVTTAQSLYL